MLAKDQKNIMAYSSMMCYAHTRSTQSGVQNYCIMEIQMEMQMLEIHLLSDGVSEVIF